MHEEAITAESKTITVVILFSDYLVYKLQWYNEFYKIIVLDTLSFYFIQYYKTLIK
jgi:hypothetical protein